MKRSIRKMFQPAGEKDSGPYDGVILHSDSSTSIQDDPQLIFKLIQEGNTCRIRSFILKNPSSLTARDHFEATPLHYASKHGHLELMLMIINETSDEALNALDNKGNTPLHVSVLKNQVDSVKVLLSRGANPNILNYYWVSPLHLAIQLHHNSIVQAIVENSTTDINLEGDLGNTPIMTACYKDNSEALVMLFNHDAKLCKRNKIGCFPIHMTAFAGSLKCMDLVLKKGEEFGFSIEDHINFTDNEKSSPLHVAVQNGRLEIVKACIGYGAKVDFKQVIDNATPLHFAASQGATEIVKFMVASYNGEKKIVDLPDGNNETPLHKSCLFDHVELAEYLISMGANIDSVDNELRTPLLMATSCSSWKTVNLLLEKGADIKLTDNYGRNFLHLTVLQPGGLKNIREEFLQREDIKHLVGDEDTEGCTPLHYACRHGVPNSVNNLLGLNMSLYSKSKNKRSALHFAAFYGRYNTCERLLRFVPDATLLNDADEKGMTPLHLAAENGHDKIVFLLLRKGALLLSDYRGWTGLHYAAFGGYTRTIKVLLDTSIALIDKPDKEKNTALHIAAREGHAKAVGLLLESGAAMTLNSLDASFIHEAIRVQRKDVVFTAIQSERWEEVLVTFSDNSNYKCPILEMVNHLPDGLKTLLDRCMVESPGDKKNWDYFVQYNFRYLQCPLAFKKNRHFENELYYEPLVTLNAMVQHNRVELLSHPVCKEYLLMKWRAYGFKAHLLNLAIYSLGLIPLTILIVNAVSPKKLNATAPERPLRLEDSYFIRTCLGLVMLMSIFGIIKEVVQIFQQKLKYLMDSSNVIDWSIHVTSIIFASCLCTNPIYVESWKWQCASIAVFSSWVNFLIYLQRFETCGIYIVMFWEILRTLLRIIAIFFFLILGFGLSFYIILTPQMAFTSPVLSLMQTFTMMLGDVNYHDSFLEPTLVGEEIEYPVLTFLHLIMFILLIPILLMNLLIGLAVGDIAEVQRNAALKRIAMQVNLHTNLEKKLPYWFLKRVDQLSSVVYPNRPRLWGVTFKSSMFSYFLTCEEFKAEAPNNDAVMELELWKQKNRLKDLSTAMQKQHELIKLIIQKMEIVSEADDEDQQDFFQHNKQKKQKIERKESKWDCVVKAVKSKT